MFGEPFTFWQIIASLLNFAFKTLLLARLVRTLGVVNNDLTNNIRGVKWSS